MQGVEAKLAAWKKLYEQCNEAQARLKQALGRNASEADLKLLRAEVTLLQEASDTALAEAEAALAAMKGKPGAPAA